MKNTEYATNTKNTENFKIQTIIKMPKNKDNTTKIQKILFILPVKGNPIYVYLYIYIYMHTYVSLLPF